VRLRAPAGTTIRKADVKVATRKTRTYTRTSAPIDLRGLPAGRYRVRVLVTFADGRTTTLTRTYRACAAKRQRR
jgi:hypothetical protein